MSQEGDAYPTFYLYYAKNMVTFILSQIVILNPSCLILDATSATDP